jgi:aryl-alcohol dehydrogenase-like predicted oxidoreductase
VALAAVLEQPWADVVLSGAVTSDQVRSNAAAAELMLSDGDLEELASQSEPAEAYWAIRSALAWS